MRCQIIWHKSAANPETKNARVNFAIGTVGGTDSLKSADVTKSSEQLIFAFNHNFSLVNLVGEFKSEVQH
jgi:predicted dinucleotide-utilizing enzyme